MIDINNIGMMINDYLCAKPASQAMEKITSKKIS